MNEVVRRKELMNKSIVEVDPALFSESLMGWLEVTHYVMGQRAGTIKPTEDGSVPPLNKKDYVLTGVQTIANNSVFAFAIAASLRGDKAAVDFVERSLKGRWAIIIPAISRCFTSNGAAKRRETHRRLGRQDRQSAFGRSA